MKRLLNPLITALRNTLVPAPVRSRRRKSPSLSVVELEQRQLLSPTGGFSPPGFHPDQTRHPYGIDRLVPPFVVGAQNNLGKGQTIAFIDFFHDPFIAGDLKAFDDQFGLPNPPSLQVVDENGGSNMPSTNKQFADETIMDVEWAHAL